MLLYPTSKNKEVVNFALFSMCIAREAGSDGRKKYTSKETSQNVEFDFMMKTYGYI